MRVIWADQRAKVSKTNRIQDYFLHLIKNCFNLLSPFREHCIPILMTLWSIRDGHVRMILLKYFGLYATSFEEEVLENFILPQVWFYCSRD